MKVLFEVDYDETKTTPSRLIHVIGSGEGVKKVKVRGKGNV